jgi:23S rRNA (cytosine1962-C5)-methyltransferase
MQALLDAIAHAQPTQDAQRVFHGRGGRHPGCDAWTLDFYPPVWVLTCFEPATEDTLNTIGEALATRWAQLGTNTPLCWVYQCRDAQHTETRLMAGEVPDPHTVTEAGLRYRVHVLKGQNHGLFLDMAEGRRWVQAHIEALVGANGRPKVLNLFAYTCSFSVVAKAAGARQVVNIDMAQGALATGQHNHQLNGLAPGASFLPHDIFSSWGKLNRLGPYDLVVADPPSYQKGSFVATKDYARLVRRLPDLLAPGGHTLLCLNAPELGVGFLSDLVREHAPELVFKGRLANPPAFEDVDPERALKVLVFRLPPAGPNAA